MKKIAVIIISILVCFSVLAVSACTKETPPEAAKSSKSVSVSEEESKAPRKSLSGNANASLTSTDLSYVNPASITNSTITVSGEGYTVTSAYGDPSTELGKAIISINMIGTVSSANYQSKEQLIINAETKCKAFSSSQIPNYNSLLSARAKFNEFKASAILIEFKNKYATLPEVANLKNVNVDLVYELIDMIKSWRTNLSTIEGFSAMEAKLTECDARIKSTTVEVTCIAQDVNGNGILESSIFYSNNTIDELTSGKKRANAGDFFNFASFNVSGGNASESITYSDTKNTNKVIYQYFNGNVSFNAPCTGTLKFYCRKGSKRTYAVTQNTEILGTLAVTDASTSDASVTLVVDIPTSGIVSVSATEGGTGYIYAIGFSYPNLG